MVGGGWWVDEILNLVTALVKADQQDCNLNDAKKLFLEHQSRLSRHNLKCKGLIDLVVNILVKFKQSF